MATRALLNRALSRRVAMMVGAENGECFKNAVLGLQLVGDGATYIEGWAADTRLPILVAHGWVELSNGRIVDPTPVWHKRGRSSQYFPARRYPRAEVERRVKRRAITILPFERGLEAGMIPRDLWAGYVAATKATLGVDIAAQLKTLSTLQRRVAQEA